MDESAAYCGRCGHELLSAVGGTVIDSTSPEDSSPTPVNALAPWRGGEVALGIVIIAVAITPVILLSAAAGELAGPYGVAAQVWAASNLMGLVILGVVWQFGLKHTNAMARGDLWGNLRLLGLNPPTTSPLWSAVLTLGALAASLAATGIYSALMRWLDAGLLIPPDIPADFAFPGAASAFTFQALAVWTPITEEIFFRGFIFAGLASRLGIRGAMAGSAVVFSLFHMDPGVLVPIFITGLLLAWLYRRTGSLWPSIAAHAGQNSLALLAAIFVI